MSTIKVFNPAGEAAGELPVADELLELEKGAQAVKDTVVAIRNGMRAGTASTLTKGEVSGRGKKPWKQKGTGRARVGYRQNPVWRGGGVAFGPKPRDYSQKINKKVAQLAFLRVISDKIAEGQVVVVEKFDVEPKTKSMVSLLKKLGLEKSVLIIVDDYTENVLLSARNLPKVDVARAADVDVYTLLLYRTIVTTQAGFEALKARMQTKRTKEVVSE
ncbi:MAG: 50S ribosomal protein L4 [Kiritimatiellae bacterium]|nr:50S ribosomal protein L4 [Kiritimatiellia bacterium]